MRYYYYSDGKEQFGPFTRDELKEKRLKKSTLVWTEGLPDWTTADEINELKDVFVAAPPPVPGKEETKQENTTQGDKDTTRQDTNSTFDTGSKYDPNYKKETEATVMGVILWIVSFLSYIFLEEIAVYFNIYNIKSLIIFILSAEIGVRVGAIIYVREIARRQNRNTTFWGWLTFFFPIIALIIIGLLKKRRFQVDIDESLPPHEQVTKLMEKAKELQSDNRMHEAIRVLNKVIELDNENQEALRRRGKMHYQIRHYDKAKNDWLTQFKLV